MEVMIPPPPAAAVDYNSASTTPYTSAPSSPQRYPSFFYSAPTSPTRISAFYGGADPLSTTPSAIPFHWEEKPGTPKSHLTTAASSNYGDADQDLNDVDFAFDFSGHLERHSLPADELFHGGVIKPLKPPPRLYYDHNRPLDSPKSPRRISPRRRRPEDADPFAAAIEQTIKQNSTDTRGRERNTNTNPPSSSSRERKKKNSRSLSPFRVSDLLFDPETNQENQTKSTSLFSSSSISSFWYKKWKIKDLLLFRSASESRAKDEEQLTKARQDVKNSSFRSTDSVGSVSSRRKSGPSVSAHELHYTVNRAFSEGMRKRTSLPYKQGLWGCLGLNPTVAEIPSVSLSRG